MIHNHRQRSEATEQQRSGDSIERIVPSQSPPPLHVPSPWRVLTTPGHSRLSVPPDATWALLDEEPVLAVTLETRPRTRVYICRWPLPDRGLGGDTATALEDQMRIFAAIGTTPLAAYRDAQLQFQSAANEQFVKSQASLELEAGECWLARSIARQGGDHFLLIHWTGPNRYLLDYVERIFDSLDFPPPTSPQTPRQEMPDALADASADAPPDAPAEASCDHPPPLFED